MDTIQTTTTRAGPRFATFAIVGALALSVAAIGAAIHDYFGGVDPNASPITRFTGAGIQGAKPDQVVMPTYLTEVSEALIAAE